MRYSALFLLMLITGLAKAQVFRGSELVRSNDKPVEVLALKSDSLTSTYCIWVEEHVAAHRHNHHTEHVYVMQGEGEFLLGNDVVSIKAGDLLVIPVGTIHAVKTTSDVPLKVISIQSPEFLGQDREFIDVEGW